MIQISCPYCHSVMAFKERQYDRLWWSCPVCHSYLEIAITINYHSVILTDTPRVSILNQLMGDILPKTILTEEGGEHE